MHSVSRFKSFVVITSCTVLAFLTVRCGVNLLSVNDDAELGKQVSQEIANDPAHYPMLNNESVRGYVQGVVNQILNAPDVKYRGTFPYSVHVIRDDKTINAFCTPGGYIYVYTGLMKYIDNEATMAGVLGHEIAHAERRHSSQRITKAYGYSIITSVVLGKNPSQASEIAANLLTGLALLKNSRSDESEADEYSFKYLRATKWYPGAINFFFQKISNGQSGGSLQEFLSTHPDPVNRMKEIQKRLDDAHIPPPTENNLFTQQYLQVKRQLP